MIFVYHGHRRTFLFASLLLLSGDLVSVTAVDTGAKA